MGYKRNSGRTPKFTTNQVLKARKGTGGIKTDIARRLKCDWRTVTKYIKENEEIHSTWLSEKEAILDMAEASLYKLVKERNLGAIKFLLSTQGKERGYGDLQKFEINKTVNGAIEHEHQHSIKLKPDVNRTVEVLEILESCGAFQSQIKQIDHSEAIEIRTA